MSDQSNINTHTRVDGRANRNDFNIFLKVGLLYIVFLPASILIHYFYKNLFIKKKNKPGFLIPLYGFISLTALILYVIVKPYKPSLFFNIVVPDDLSIMETILETIQQISFFSSIFYLLLNFWWVSVILSFFVISFIIYKRDREIKRNSVFTKRPNTVWYNWQYKRTPLDKRKRDKKIQELQSGNAGLKEASAIGLSADYKTQDDMIYLYDKEMTGHTLVVGGTGSGKTVTVMAAVKHDIEVNKPVVYIDFKRSDTVAAKLARWAHENNVPFYHFLDEELHEYSVPYSESPSTYNPFKNAGSTTTEMMLNMRQYDVAADHYKNAANLVITSVYKMIRVVKRHPKMFIQEVNGKKQKIVDFNKGEIFYWLDVLENVSDVYNVYAQILRKKGKQPDKRIQTLVRKMEGGSGGRGPSVEQAALESVKSSLLQLVNSPYEKYFDTAQDLPTIDFIKAIKERAVVLFSFSSDSQKDFSKSFGELIVQDITNVSAQKRDLQIEDPDIFDTDVHIYIDEFQVLDSEILNGLLTKGRESKMATTVISQSLSQIKTGVDGSRGASVLETFLDTCNIFIIHNGSSYESAEQIAKIIGKKMETKYITDNLLDTNMFSLNYSERRITNFSTREEEEWIRSPKEIMNLRKSGNVNGEFLPSQAILIKKNSINNSEGDIWSRKVDLYVDEEAYSRENKVLLEAKSHTTKEIYDDEYEDDYDYYNEESEDYNENDYEYENDYYNVDNEYESQDNTYDYEEEYSDNENDDYDLDLSYEDYVNIDNQKKPRKQKPKSKPSSKQKRRKPQPNSKAQKSTSKGKERTDKKASKPQRRPREENVETGRKRPTPNKNRKTTTNKPNTRIKQSVDNDINTKKDDILNRFKNN